VEIGKTDSMTAQATLNSIFAGDRLKGQKRSLREHFSGKGFHAENGHGVKGFRYTKS